MKSNLENNFKDAFEQYELPYNESAWTSLNEKLDKLQGGNTPKATSGNSQFKWIAGAAIAIIASSALIYSLVKDDGSVSPTNDKAIAKQTEQTSEINNNLSSGSGTGEKNGSSEGTDGQTVISTPQGIKTSEGNELTNTKSAQEKEAVSTNRRNGVEKPAYGNDNTSFPVNQTNTSQHTSLPVTPGHEEPGGNSKSILFPEFKNVCEGDVLSVKNKNPFTILIVSPGGKETSIPADQSVDYTVSESGNYTVYSKDVKRSVKTFTANAAPNVDFIINEEIKYENGIPSVPLETYSDGSNFEWSFEDSPIRQSGSKANARFYKKGTYDITLTAKGTSGCTSSISKTITINEDYNLLAPSGFLPSSDNPRNNRFIPLALTVRNTEFKMFIIEPRTGTVIFETTSVEGWDGTDRTTHRLAEENKSYAWKVILANPEPGEQKEYSGIVVRL